MADATKPAKGAAAVPDPHILTALRLRQLAEKASGLREQELVLAYVNGKSGGEPGWDLVSEGQARNLGPPQIRVNPPPMAGTWKPRSPDGGVTRVGVTYPQGSVDLVELECDAFFWSTAAIEKFVLTYYLPLLDPEDWLPLYLRVNGRIGGDPLYGIMHTYPSIPEFMTARGITRFLTPAGLIPEGTFISDSRQLLLESKFRGLL